MPHAMHLLVHVAEEDSPNGDASGLHLLLLYHITIIVDCILNSICNIIYATCYAPASAGG